MVAEHFLQDPQVPQWLDGVEPAWMLLTFDSLQRQERRDRDPDRQRSQCRRDGRLRSGAQHFPPATTGDRPRRPAADRNLSRAVVAEMRELIKWPGYDQTDACVSVPQG